MATAVTVQLVQLRLSCAFDPRKNPAAGDDPIHNWLVSREYSAVNDFSLKKRDAKRVGVASKAWSPARLSVSLAVEHLVLMIYIYMHVCVCVCMYECMYVCR